MIAYNLQVYLEDEGMEVRCVGSAEAALVLISRGAEYDVCIMDLRLPGMDGNLGILALHRLCPTLKFIIHTGSSNYLLSDDVRALGVQESHLFRKPVPDMAVLAKAVRELAEC
jgi:CheY-like chemotaxis protein